MIDRCPFCGEDEYYVVTRMSGVGQTNYRFDGRDADNCGLHDCLTYTCNKTARCCGCDAKLGIVDHGDESRIVRLFKEVRDAQV